MLGGCSITATGAVHNLRITMDSCLDCNAEVSTIVRTCNYHLSQIACVHCYIITEACKLAVLALVISHLGYCNDLLSVGTEQQLSKLQSIQNQAVRLVVREATGATQSGVACQPELAAAPLAASVTAAGIQAVFACAFLSARATHSMPGISDCVGHPISSEFLATQRGEREELALV